MKFNKITLVICIVFLVFSLMGSIVLADCTIVALGKDA